MLPPLFWFNHFPITTLYLFATLSLTNGKPFSPHIPPEFAILYAHPSLHTHCPFHQQKNSNHLPPTLSLHIPFQIQEYFIFYFISSQFSSYNHLHFHLILLFTQDHQVSATVTRSPLHYLPTISLHSCLQENM